MATPVKTVAHVITTLTTTHVAADRGIQGPTVRLLTTATAVLVKTVVHVQTTLTTTLVSANLDF